MVYLLHTLSNLHLGPIGGFFYEGQATVNANNLKHANLIDFRNNVQRVELVAVLQCGSQRRDPGLSDDVR